MQTRTPSVTSPRQRLLRVAEALARVEAAIESLVIASDRVRAAQPLAPEAQNEMADALESARIVRAKLETALRRCPPHE